MSESAPYIKKPDWLKVRLPHGEELKSYNEIKLNLKSKNLHTVCEEASCPNISECWSKKTATIMILGDTCTRACKFCDISTGNPKGFINLDEVSNASLMVKTMSLRYIVITSVDRDDLPDFGATHFRNVIERIHTDHPSVYVEVLIPDFNGDPRAMHTLAQSRPFVIAHNLETVRSKTSIVRDRRAGYDQSLDCLKFYKDFYPEITTKSSLMVGVGESKEELVSAMKDLRSVGCNILTIGQYLRPTQRHLEIKKYYSPTEFFELKEIANDLGFDFVASGPLVRSSYKAIDYLLHLEKKGIKV